MQNFIYYNPVKILFGKGQIAHIADEIPVQNKILMTYGGGSIEKNGVYDQVMKALKDHQVVEFSGIEPNPHYETCMRAVEIIKREKIDFILAVGGGSVLDATKLIAAAVYFEGDPWDILAKSAEIKKAILSLVKNAHDIDKEDILTRVVLLIDSGKSAQWESIISLLESKGVLTTQDRVHHLIELDLLYS